MRCFISLDLPEDILDYVLEIQNQLPEFKGNFVAKDNLHLTLKFLGEVDSNQLNTIREDLKKIKFKPFQARINKIGVFSQKEIRIIWLAIENCESLQKEIDSILSKRFSKEKRFMGHLTIARVKSLNNKDLFLENLKKIKTKPQNFIIDKFFLKQSVLTPKCSIYKNIEEYSLQKFMKKYN